MNSFNKRPGSPISPEIRRPRCSPVTQSSTPTSPNHCMSISSLLSSNYIETPAVSPHQTLSRHEEHNISDRIRTIIAPPSSIVVQICHSIAAQKSYGSEKRFICPPPVVKSNSFQYSSNVSVSVSGPDQGPSQCLTLEKGVAQFSHLHVGGKAKSFQLEFSVVDNQEYFPFITQPIAIISKPSRKSTKVRNPQACIYSGSTVSLFTRINSQTVRTNYLSVEDDTLTISRVEWTPFLIYLADGSSGIIYYGSKVILEDTRTGLKTDLLEVCRVDRRTVVESTGPVAHMQKMALRASQNGFLSSSTALQTFKPSNQSLKNNLAYITPNPDQIIDDREIWTIVGTTMSEHLFTPIKPSLHSLPVLTHLVPPWLNSPLALIRLVLDSFSNYSEFWIGSYGPLPYTSDDNVVSISLPDPLAVLKFLDWSPSSSTSFNIPLIVSLPSGSLISVGYDINVIFTQANPIYSRASYSHLIPNSLCKS